jgi:hypothetical protein
MRKHRFQTIGSNAIDPATTTAKDWGFIPVSGKGGNTNNAVIPEWMFQRELNDLMEGGAVNA